MEEFTRAQGQGKRQIATLETDVKPDDSVNMQTRKLVASFGNNPGKK